MKRIVAILLVAVMLLSVVACSKKTPTTTAGTTTGGNSAVVTPGTDYYVIELKNFEDYADKEIANLSNLTVGKEYGADKDYISVYEKFGSDIKITDVIEDKETGTAYIEKDGKLYTLGLDFLTMAMVYNVAVPAELDGCTADDVYATWWRLYIQRWNALLPEIPLYSNEYYDLYNSKITGVQENPTNPYWGVANALIDWTSTKADKSFIIGNSTDLSGKFRYAAFGSTSPGAADNDVATLTQGLETVTTNKEGGYVWNDTVVASHKETENADGSKTFEITIKEGLKFSDGSAITAKNYVITSLVFSTPVAAQAAGKDHQSAMTIVGYDTFKNYTGVEAEGATKYLSGLRLLGDYTFSVTIAADYLPYFYDIGYASFSPSYTKLWLGNADVKDDGNGCYITEDFFAKNGEDYTMAAHVKASALNTDTTYPYSGAYVVESYDASTKTATLKVNTYFAGNYEGTKPAIEKIIYKKIITTTQLEDAKAGNLDFIAGITGGDETNEALTFIEESNGGFACIHYGRAGYGKLGFRADFGPVQFTEVRQAIAYCMDRATFAKDFTGGFGGVVDGPYYKGSWMYKHAMAQGMQLDAYATSLDAAIKALEDGGWVYAADGSAYTSGVRYKKIADAEMQDSDKTFQSKDGAYKTVKVGEYWYMPLVINWYGTSDNPFTDLLVTGFMENDNIAAAGMVVQNTIGEFNPMLDELYQMPVYGYYAGTPLYGAFNFATGFNSAVYDFSWNMTIDPSMYDNYSYFYLKDAADFYWNAK